MSDPSSPNFFRHLGTVLCVALCGAPVALAQAGHFQTEIAFQHGEKLGGCAIGDLDPRYPGQEIVAVSVLGEVFVLHLERGRWRSELVYRSTGEALQCAIGNVLAERPGNELLVVGMAKGTEEDSGPGAAHLVHWDGQSWQGQKLLEEPALIHGVAVGASHALLVGFTKEAVLLEERDGRLRATARLALPGNGKTAVASEDGYLVACSDGSLVRISNGADGDTGEWQVKTLARRDAGRARLAVAKDGTILSADDDGALQMLSPAHTRIVHQEGAKLRGAAFGPFVPGHPVPGHQLATAGYQGELTILLPRPDGSYLPQIALRDLDRFHHLAAGTLGDRPGRAVAACGYAGRVVVVRWVP